MTIRLPLLLALVLLVGVAPVAAGDDEPPAAKDPHELKLLLEQQLAEAEQKGNHPAVIDLLERLARLHLDQGWDEARTLALFDRALRMARRRRLPLRAGSLLEGLATQHARLGDHAKALRRSLDAVALLEQMLGDLAEESAAVRGRQESVFWIGLTSALAQEDLEAVSYFLEAERYGPLLERLAGRRALRHVVLPRFLIEEDKAAEARLAEARRERQRALEQGGLKRARQASKALDAAKSRRLEAAARMERAAKAMAGLAYPRSVPLVSIQGLLREDEAFVSYGRTRKDAMALVVRRDAARIVPLGPQATVFDAVLDADPGDNREDWKEDADRLAALLVTPLALSDGVTRILVSPTGYLWEVPFSLLLGKRSVAYVPSGTAFEVLRKERGSLSGQGVLALGDPDLDGPDGSRSLFTPRTRRLPPLPATREEAKAVGDEVLLGLEASEKRLGTALQSRQRWRALHLACHVLHDRKRPLLSAMVLAPDAENDGFLTALEILRMAMPADLVVVSTELGTGWLETAPGGPYGLARALLSAGAPRVIGCLWSPDDDATAVLMKAFYERWYPKSRRDAKEEDDAARVSAAEALRAAQETVRRQEKWAHPHYWAGWILVGLPD